MMELPSLQALDQAQASRIWLAVEPTDMRCVSEREMKRVVLNRKNSLFVGNPRGGRTAAILASLTSTCRRHEVDPQLYLTQLLMNLPQAKMSELSDWLPDQWKLRHVARMAALNTSPPAH